MSALFRAAARQGLRNLRSSAALSTSARGFATEGASSGGSSGGRTVRRLARPMCMISRMNAFALETVHTFSIKLISCFMLGN